jgi:hypothetical protein
MGAKELGKGRAAHAARGFSREEPRVSRHGSAREQAEREVAAHIALAEALAAWVARGCRGRLSHRRGILDEQVITDRQVEILALAAQGLSLGEIAERLVVSPSTSPAKARGRKSHGSLDRAPARLRRRVPAVNAGIHDQALDLTSHPRRPLAPHVGP